MQSPDQLAQTSANFKRYVDMLVEIEKGLGEAAEVFDGGYHSEAVNRFVVFVKQTAESIHRNQEAVSECQHAIEYAIQAFEQMDDDLAKSNFR